MEQQSKAEMIEGLRRDVQRLSEAGVSVELRSAAVAYYRLRAEQGATQGVAAGELGMNRWTLAKWFQQTSDRKRPLKVKAAFELDAEGAQLKEEIDGIGPCSPSRRYPEELRERISSWARGHRAKGARAGALAQKLGIPWESLSRWTGERPVGPKPKPKLQAVTVVADRAATSGIVLRTRQGFWVEGLDVPTLLELLGKL